MATAVLRRLSTMEQTALEAKEFLANDAYWTLGKEDTMDVDEIPKKKEKKKSPSASPKKKKTAKIVKKAPKPAVAPATPRPLLPLHPHFLRLHLLPRRLRATQMRKRRTSSSRASKLEPLDLSKVLTSSFRLTRRIQ